ncbi:MAG: carboxymuconolactone decarboxylase family protein [Novosphingobium sp.]|nr:carboxymuconolactone decarboxylase family protein [Novosphingobium sp.]MCP5401387.1 carboxymuconolactone decarboxylase family protein [Novosphingobium sp.]
MERFPVLGRDELDADQRKLWDELTLGPRGFYTGGAEAERLPDLYNAWLQFPEFGELMIRLGDAIRATSELSGKLRELIVLTTSAILGARVEFDFHVPFAQNEGLSDELIEAIGSGETPPFADDPERIVYEANVQLLRTARLTPETREEAIEAIGYRGLMQLIAAVTLYVVTAYTTNVARVKLADDFSADPDMLKDFFAGKQVSPD